MTKKNKELIKEKKRLEGELDLARSIGVSDSGGQDALAQMRNELDASQRAQSTSKQQVVEIEAQL